MNRELPAINDTYRQLHSFLENAKQEADMNTRLLLLQQDLGNYVKKDKIDEMIKEAIKQHDLSAENAKKGQIQWGGIFERIIITVIIAGIVALVIKGMG